MEFSLISSKSGFYQQIVLILVSKLGDISFLKKYIFAIYLVRVRLNIGIFILDSVGVIETFRNAKKLVAFSGEKSDGEHRSHSN